VVVGIGVFFVAFRPPLLPEDRRYIAAPGPAFDAVLPDLGRWLKKVFWVMGGYMIATGILTIHLALFVVRGGSAIAWVIAVAAGVASVGLWRRSISSSVRTFGGPCWASHRYGRPQRSSRHAASEPGRRELTTRWAAEPCSHVANGSRGWSVTSSRSHTENASWVQHPRASG